jgi:hypothetical protein
MMRRETDQFWYFHGARHAIECPEASDLLQLDVGNTSGAAVVALQMHGKVIAQAKYVATNQRP